VSGVTSFHSVDGWVDGSLLDVYRLIIKISRDPITCQMIVIWRL
jgi:hypothetical protein